MSFWLGFIVGGISIPLLLFIILIVYLFIKDGGFP